MSQIWEVLLLIQVSWEQLRAIKNQRRGRAVPGLGTEGLLNKTTLPEHRIFEVQPWGSEGRGTWRKAGAGNTKKEHPNTAQGAGEEQGKVGAPLRGCCSRVGGWRDLPGQQRVVKQILGGEKGSERFGDGLCW